MNLKRSGGILMPLSALPNKYGIGTFGKCAYDFVNFLKRSNLSIWQILPLNPISYGDSPYSSCDYNSIAYQYIDLEKLVSDGLLLKDELKDLDKDYLDFKVDYSILHTIKMPLLKMAFSRFDKTNKAFLSFVENKEFHDYAIYMTIKDLHNFNSWTFFNEKYKKYSLITEYEILKNYKDLYLFWVWSQYEALNEWLKLKAYANKNGIIVIGDMPIYEAYDSINVWKNPKYFMLNDDKTIKYIGGCPSDNTYPFGQNWGVPCYNYDEIKKDNYRLFDKKFSFASKIYDYVRLDHFIGYFKYYAIDGKTLDATNGIWLNGPGLDLINRYKNNNIIIEDLGIKDDEFIKAKDELGFLGMKVLEYAFDGNSDNEYNPTNITKNYVVYSTTHDNLPLKTFIESRNEDALIYYKNLVALASSKLGVEIDGDSPSALAYILCELGYASDATMAIMPMWDLLGLDYKARFNLPNTVSVDNWSYRFKRSDFSLVLSYKLYKMMKKYNRN